MTKFNSILLSLNYTLVAASRESKDTAFSTELKHCKKKMKICIEFDLINYICHLNRSAPVLGGSVVGPACSQLLFMSVLLGLSQCGQLGRGEAAPVRGVTSTNTSLWHCPYRGTRRITRPPPPPRPAAPLPPPRLEQHTTCLYSRALLTTARTRLLLTSSPCFEGRGYYNYRQTNIVIKTKLIQIYII